MPRQTREILHNACLRYWYPIPDRSGPDEIDKGAYAHLAQAVRERNSEKAADIRGPYVSHSLRLLEQFPYSSARTSSVVRWRQ